MNLIFYVILSNLKILFGRFGLVGLIWFGLVWFGLVWFGLVGLVWYEDCIKKGRIP